MELLNDAPPGYEGVAKAFEMAKHLPTTHRMDVQVGLLRDGVLFARGRLAGYRQVTFFAEHVRDLGWREHLLGSEDDMHGCDMLFSHPGELASEDADPSFIRRPAVQLWPAGSNHADP
ncbi:MAG TPA: hypothetical protein VHL79_23470 [Ramlibacter sp.]|nr:hypothetical protein [Ramlibacter sp.]